MAIRVNKGTSEIAGVARQPRSFADYVLGKTTTKFTRPKAVKPVAFKAKPTSDGKGVGM